MARTYQSPYNQTARLSCGRYHKCRSIAELVTLLFAIQIVRDSHSPTPSIIVTSREQRAQTMASHSAGDAASPVWETGPRTIQRLWHESRQRARTDKRSWDYGKSTGLVTVVLPAVGLVLTCSRHQWYRRRNSGLCREYLWSLQTDRVQAKTAIAPLDRVKILFQTSNKDFQKYAGGFGFSSKG